MDSLPIFLSLRNRPVIVIGTGEAADAKRRLIARAGGVPSAEDAAAPLAVIALNDPADCAAAAARLRARGILVNVVDRPDLCDFTFPAIVDRSPVLVAIASGGRSAGLAKALRQRIEALLPPGLGRLADALYAARPAIRARWPDAADRRRALDAALSECGPLDPMGDPDPAAVARLADGAAILPPSRVVPIALASPDPDDLTLRAARLLGQADRIFHRRDVPEAILIRARADAARIPCDGAPSDPPPGLSLDLEMVR